MQAVRRLPKMRNSGRLNVLDDRVALGICSKHLLSQLLHSVSRIHVVCDLEVVLDFQHVLQGALVGTLGHVAFGGGGALVIGARVGGGGKYDRVCTEDLVDGSTLRCYWMQMRPRSLLEQQGLVL